jgi:lipopolysaccharide transport system permease protein
MAREDSRSTGMRLGRALAAPVLNCWKHRGLLLEVTKRNIEVTTRGSALGLVWLTLNPLLMLGLYFFVFGTVFRGSFGVVADESRFDYALGVFLALTLFRTVGESIGSAPQLIINNTNLVKKVVFPLDLIPTAAVGGTLYSLLSSMALFVIGLLVSGRDLSLAVLWLPVIVAPLIFFALGFSLMLSALGVFFRDLSQAVPIVMLALMYASGVFYSAAKVPPSAWAILRFNPLFQANELARNVVLWDSPLNGPALLYLYAVGLTCWGVGHFIFRRLQPAFADVL